MKAELLEANLDVIRLFKSSKLIGWNDLKEQSVYRILYLSSVLYSFMFPGEHFKEGYDFTVDMTGPYSKGLRDALTFLVSNDIILLKENKEYELNKSNELDLSNSSEQDRKTGWLKNVLYILGTYGEKKVYEFVIRDPEYRANIETNSLQSLNTDETNRTIEFLNSIKQQFEKKLAEENNKPDKNKYLELYFEYVFSKVLTGNV